MGGEVLVRSEPGTGTTFTVRLMLSVANPPLSMGSPRRVTGHTGPQLTVLIADDDPAHLGLATGVLEPIGFRVLAAANGAQCLQLAREQPPQLALLDISMPDMTGWQIAARLREMQQSTGLRIIMVSANAHEYSPGADGNALHDDFIIKPMEIQQMLEKVGNVLGLEWVYDAPAAASAAATARGELSVSSLHHLEDLYRLGRIGHVRGIEIKLAELEAEDPRAATVAAQLRTLVTNFDLKSYMSVVDTLRTKAQHSAP
jgi:CheY-like chemotaxis protein